MAPGPFALPEASSNSSTGGGWEVAGREARELDQGEEVCCRVVLLEKGGTAAETVIHGPWLLEHAVLCQPHSPAVRQSVLASL
uniref:Uncharacterized protein n=1 Tax=Setaria viridis TaxID=4556 RepID=A0A4U6UD51_SETVI|nr:hypothetical protein SEVIR_6G239801v2 [Setaria viridis]